MSERITLPPERFADRRTGGVDPVDLVVGIVLVVLIPVLSVVLVRAFGVETRSDAGDFRAEVELADLPLEPEEVEMRWETARRIYEKNARDFMKTRDELEEGPLKEHLRGWALNCLRNADSVLHEVTALAGDPRYSKYATEAAAMRRRIETDIEDLEKLDILGLDDRRRGLSEQEVRDAGPDPEQ